MIPSSVAQSVEGKRAICGSRVRILYVFYFLSLLSNVYMHFFWGGGANVLDFEILKTVVVIRFSLQDVVNHLNIHV